jgi:hypothetical protein
MHWVSVAIVVLFAGGFALGLLLYMLDPGSAPAGLLLESALLALMAAPVVRLAAAVSERLRWRDWSFLLMASIVAVELGIVLWRAANK